MGSADSRVALLAVRAVAVEPSTLAGAPERTHGLADVLHNLGRRGGRVAEITDAAATSKSVAARGAGDSATSKVRTQGRGEGSTPGQLGDGTSGGRGGLNSGTVDAEAGGRARGGLGLAASGGGREEAADSGIELLGGRRGEPTLLLAQPGSRMDRLAGRTDADGNGDGLKVSGSVRSSRMSSSGEFGANQLRGHLRASGQVLAQSLQGRGCPDASVGRHDEACRSADVAARETRRR